MATVISCDLWLLDTPVYHMQAGHKPGFLMHWKDSKWVRWIKTCWNWTVCISISYLYSCLYNVIIAQTDTHKRARARSHAYTHTPLICFFMRQLTVNFFNFKFVLGQFVAFVLKTSNRRMIFILMWNAPFIFLCLSCVAWWNDPSGRLKMMY